MKNILLALILIVLLAASCKNPKTQQSKPETAAQQEVFDLINQARAKPQRCGDRDFPAVSALRYNSKLAAAAQNHSEDMASTNTLSHLTPANSIHYRANSDLKARIKAEGYGNFSIAAENIAKGQSSAKQVVDEWMASKSHCGTIMNAMLTETGIGHSGDFWAQDFAKPRF